MSLETLILYIIAAFVVILIPGPLSLFMVANTVRHGILKSYPAFLGGTLASSLYLIISASGVGVLITTSPRLYLTLKILGAAYLVYLGIMTIRVTAKKSPANLIQADQSIAPSFRSLFKKAFLLGASNPKDMIFFIAFLPQFISPTGNLVQQTTIIVSTWIMVDIICKLLYGFMGKSIRPFLNTPKTMSVFDTTTGGLYITAGVVAALVA